MKFAIAALVSIAALALAGCADHQGNPNQAAYANEDGGTIATKPQFISQESYDPYGKPAPFKDMQAGGAAISPSGTPPLDLTTNGQSPTPPAPMPANRPR
jgi:hypothetical protein